MARRVHGGSRDRINDYVTDYPQDEEGAARGSSSRDARAAARHRGGARQQPPPAPEPDGAVAGPSGLGRRHHQGAGGGGRGNGGRLVAVRRVVPVAVAGQDRRRIVGTCPTGTGGREYVRILHPKDWASLIHRHRVRLNWYPNSRCRYDIHIVQPKDTLARIPELVFVLNKLLRKSKVRCSCSEAMGNVYDGVIKSIASVFLDERGATRRVVGNARSYQDKDWLTKLLRYARGSKILFTF